MIWEFYAQLFEELPYCLAQCLYHFIFPPRNAQVPNSPQGYTISHCVDIPLFVYPFVHPKLVISGFLITAILLGIRW